MADRTAAALFGDIFRLIAEHVPMKKRKALATRFAKETGNFDFNSYQMSADDALTSLDLLRQGKDEDGEPRWLYWDDDGFDEAPPSPSLGSEEKK